MPRTLRHNKAIQTDILDPETQKPVILTLSPPLNTLGFRQKQSKTTVTIPLIDCYMAAKHAKGDDFKVVKRVKRVELDIPHKIREMLQTNRQLHLAQIRQSLEKEGVEISRKVAGSLLSLMERTGEVERDERLYYHLKAS